MLSEIHILKIKFARLILNLQRNLPLVQNLRNILILLIKK